MKEFGLNLYSIRTLIGTGEAFLDTALKLKEDGYSFMQYSGASLSVETIGQVVRKSGMPIVLTHNPLDAIVHETERLMEEHASFGCRNIGLGMMPLPILREEKTCKETIEALDRAGERMEKNGFRFFYHHHHYEFLRYGDETVFDYMIRCAPHINFTADTYWLQYGGVDVIPFLSRLRGRIGCLHLKDYRIHVQEDGTFAPEFAPVGDGTLDFKRIISVAEELGTEYFLVEQDNAVDYEQPLRETARSAAYLKREIVG